MREIKFRAWDGQSMIFMGKGGYCDFELRGGEVYEYDSIGYEAHSQDYPLMQSTGLKDKNGVEIYELSEMDHKFEVIYKNAKYVLRSISSGDIVCPLFDYMESNKNAEITREYSKI